MKNYLKIFTSLLISAIIMNNVEAQTRTKIKTKSDEPKFVEQNFGSPASVADVADIADSSLAYNSVKNLIDKKVTLAYEDNSFRGNEPIRRGDFIVALNSAIDAVKKVETEHGITSSDNSMAVGAVSTVEEKGGGTNGLTGFQDGSVYYPAAQSLMQKGVNLSFEKSKIFNPGSPMSEKEVYEILNNVFGYSTAGMNPYATTMSRSKFAMALDNALSTKLQQDYAIIDQKNAEAEQDRQAEQQSLQAQMQQQEQMKRDSLNSAYQAEQMAIEKKAQENLSKKKKGK
ncbi:MAG: S-layer homology domain-containing protein [Ginsengibacter sp.]